MKPRVKNDSWCYTASNRAAREKIKRLSNKRHRQNNRKTNNGEAWGSPLCFLLFFTVSNISGYKEWNAEESAS